MPSAATRRWVAAARAVVALSLAVAWPAVVSGTERSKVHRAHDAAWTLDLREQGYQVGPMESRGGGEEDTGLAFGSNTELVVLDHSVKDRRIHEVDWSTRAFIIDARSGTVVWRRAWTGRGDSAVFATATGNYAVLDGGTVLYGPGLVEEVTRSPRWVAMISPSGGRLAARTRPVKAEVWITMDAATLAETGVIPAFYRGSVADGSIARCALRLHQAPSIEIATTGKPPVLYPPKWGEGHPFFVSERMLVVLGPERLDVISTDGEMLFSVGGGWEAGTRVTASRDGRRMAVTQERYMGHWQDLKSEDVTVYDLEARSPIWTVKHRGMKGAFSGHSGIALSPDGSLLAINSRGIVTLFGLPTGEAH